MASCQVILKEAFLVSPSFVAAEDIPFVKEGIDLAVASCLVLMAAFPYFLEEDNPFVIAVGTFLVT